MQAVIDLMDDDDTDVRLRASRLMADIYSRAVDADRAAGHRRTAP